MIQPLYVYCVTIVHISIVFITYVHDIFTHIIYTYMKYSAIKVDKISLKGIKWMNLEDKKPSEISQNRKTTTLWSYLCTESKCRTHEERSEQWLPAAEERGGGIGDVDQRVHTFSCKMNNLCDSIVLW